MSVVVSTTGADRWRYGHPWIYRSDVTKEPGDGPGIVPGSDRRGRFRGKALYSPKSEIRLRLLTRDPAPITATWWRDRIAEALAARERITASAYRVVHAEGDGLPSLVVDRYGPYVVAQLLSAGLEHARADVLAGIAEVLDPAGIVLRNDAAVRRHEGLPLEVVTVAGAVPHTVEGEEGGGRYPAPPPRGQKTRALLAPPANRARLCAPA